MSRDEERLQYLIRFFDAKREFNAVSQVMQFTPTRRGKVLRDHRSRGVYNPTELDLRDGIDAFIHFIGVLELAVQFRFLGDGGCFPDFVSNEGQVIVSTMTDDFLRRYYTRIYPERLPQIFSKRMRLSKWVAGDFIPSLYRDIELFYQLIQLDRVFLRDPNLKQFLLLLDDYTIRGVRWWHVWSRMANPENILRVFVGENGDSHNVLHKGILGLEQFFLFAARLRTILLDLNDDPVLHSSIWNHYAYWFDVNGSNVKRKLEMFIEHIGKWDVALANREASLARIAEASEAVQFMSDPNNFVPLDEVFDLNA
jgi:hypothetical protein